MLVLTREGTLAPVLPELPFLDAVAASKEAERRTFVDALLGRRTQPAPADATGSLDGGARRTIERPETHAETLARVLRDHSADAGANL
jgi:hypothetical protein